MSDNLQSDRPGLQDDEVKQVAELLAKLKPGFWPRPIFNEVTRIAAMPIVEIVPLRLRDGKPEVLLMQREADDPVWPGELHTPGTVVRATDLQGSVGNFDHIFARLLDGEMGGTQIAGKPYFVEMLLHDSGRGTEVSQIYWVEVVGEPAAGKFCPTDALPQTFVASQKDFLAAAVKSFVAFKQQ